MSDELLFNTYQIYGVLQAQPEAAKKRIQAIPAATLLNASEHDLVQALIEEFRLNVPVIDEDRIYIAESGEAQVDVSGDPMRMIYDRSQAFYIPGNRTVIAVLFLAKITIGCRIKYINRVSNSALSHVKLALCSAH